MKVNITEPTLLLNEEICKSNIARMAQKAYKANLEFKPHMKTHQSAKVAQWFRDAGVKAITVSSLKMAQYFARHGWNDITIAFPANIRQAAGLNQLASKISLTVLLSNTATIELLASKLSNNVDVYIEIDSGGHRSGIQVDEIPKIERLLKTLQETKYLKWLGFYSHPGHSYNASSISEIKQIHDSVLDQIQYLKTQIPAKWGKPQICIGDTPCCSVADNFGGIDAISPGNFVFYDLMQHQIGSCQVQNIAVAMQCPVVDKYPDRNELIIYGGAIHFSKESIEEGYTHFGRVAIKEADHWKLSDKGTYLKSLSQEHGIVKCTSGSFKNYPIGDLITVLPVHSCLTAHLMGPFLLTTGETINQF